MPTPSVLGDRLLLARRHKGLSQKDLGKTMGLSAHTVGLLERGVVTHVRSDAIREAAKVLGVTTDYLLGLTDRPMGYQKVERDDAGSRPTGADSVEADAAPAGHAAALPRDGVCA